MYVWSGAAWAAVTSVVNSSTGRTVPTLWGHSMAWGATAGAAGTGALIVAGGLLTTGWSPNSETWYVTLSDSGGKWQATWTLASPQPGCQAAVSSPPDSVVHTGARMAYDPAAGVQVFFGGREGLLSYGNTVECR